MKDKMRRLLGALDSERAYGILLAILGVSCLIFSSFAPIILDIVTVAAGIFLLFGALLRALVLIADGKRELLFFSNLLKEALLIFSGITLILLRSDFAGVICTFLGVYMIIRYALTIFFIAGTGGKAALTPMEKAETVISVILIVLGLLMIIFPRFSNLLVGTILTLKGLELIIKSAPHKRDGDKDKNDYITDEFVDKSDE